MSHVGSQLEPEPLQEAPSRAPAVILVYDLELNL